MHLASPDNLNPVVLGLPRNASAVAMERFLVNRPTLAQKPGMCSRPLTHYLAARRCHFIPKPFQISESPAPRPHPEPPAYWIDRNLAVHESRSLQAAPHTGSPVTARPVMAPAAAIDAPVEWPYNWPGDWFESSDASAPPPYTPHRIPPGKAPPKPGQASSGGQTTEQFIDIYV